MLEWNVGLLSMAMLLLLPKKETSQKFNLFLNLITLTTILCLTVGHSWVPLVVPLGFTVLLCVTRVARQPTVGLRLRIWGQALIFAMFAYRCEKFYPFRHWIGIPSGLLIAVIVGILIYIFRPSQMEARTVWSMVFPIWVTLELCFASSTSLIEGIGWFWQVELVLYFTQLIWIPLKNRILKFRQRVV